jgi:oxepin-CoA hydrolase / 3-oxo-5,6-dehydrosuberyl-CoA semialdehyde dehydrogenase
MIPKTPTYIAKIPNYVSGRWLTGSGSGELLLDAVTSEPLAIADTEGMDMEAALHWARTVGNPALRKLSFHERGRMLKALASYLQERKEPFYALSYHTGATRADSWIDIEGGIGNLFAYASLRRKFPDMAYCTDGDPVQLGKGGSFMAQHLLVPREGVAVHINAYNFPVWGMLEKCAVNWLAGMPAVVKPSPYGAYLAQAVAKAIIESGILPEGSLQIICGAPGPLLDCVTAQDVVTFTGSRQTGLLLKSHERILKESVPFNIEADSLNALVLGKDSVPGTPEWELFVKEVRKEITVKAGQKCTAVRRIFVPEHLLEDATKALQSALAKTLIGNPLNDGVRMGALAGLPQRERVRQNVQQLLASAQLVYGSLDGVQLIDADAQKGAFMSPLLLLNDRPFDHGAVHEVEAFGPVSTIMPYKDLDAAIALSKLGKGSLCCSIVTANKKEAANFVVGAATHHGRILVLNKECANESTGHGSPLPMLVHGGPGRAGGGEEMGGLRGVKHYLQRVAVQGSPQMLTAITQTYQTGAPGIPATVHPFRKYFEELEVGYQLLTEKRMITAGDIDHFARLSGDHFYAHKKETHFGGTMFEQQVAHGYFILSAAAGLFVEGSDIGPVLLNYGIDELRFTKPVYPGTEIGVRFTCKEKMPQDNHEESEIPRGIVKWLVEVLDDEGEPVAVGTILTMVRRKTNSPA